MGVENEHSEQPQRTAFGCQSNSADRFLSTQAATKSFGRLQRQRGMRRIVGPWAAPGFLISMLLGSALISWMSLPYFDFETLPPFVVEKLPLRFGSLWFGALRIHVAAAGLSFPLCLLLTTRVLQRLRLVHRWLGRISGFLVLLALVPSGVVLSFDAKGGPIVTAGFLLSGLIVAGAMIIGVQAARRRNLNLHARAMRHVVGQMSVAVVSRALIVGLDVASIDPEVAYVAALWGPVLASVAVVEWFSRRPIIGQQNRVQLVERIARELSPLALLVHVRALFRPVARHGR